MHEQWRNAQEMPSREKLDLLEQEKAQKRLLLIFSDQPCLGSLCDLFVFYDGVSCPPSVVAEFPQLLAFLTLVIATAMRLEPVTWTPPKCAERSRIVSIYRCLL
jgi:hypothetical protein